MGWSSEARHLTSGLRGTEPWILLPLWRRIDSRPTCLLRRGRHFLGSVVDSENRHLVHYPVRLHALDLLGDILSLSVRRPTPGNPQGVEGGPGRLDRCPLASHPSFEEPPILGLDSSLHVVRPNDGLIGDVPLRCDLSW